MEDYTDYELSALIDLLAERTARYTEMMKEGFHHGKEFSQIGEEILAIQQAIWKKMGFDDPAQKKFPEK